MRKRDFMKEDIIISDETKNLHNLMQACKIDKIEITTTLKMEMFGKKVTISNKNIYVDGMMSILWLLDIVHTLINTIQRMAEYIIKTK